MAFIRLGRKVIFSKKWTSTSPVCFQSKNLMHTPPGETFEEPPRVLITGNDRKYIPLNIYLKFFRNDKKIKGIYDRLPVTKCLIIDIKLSNISYSLPS